MEKRKGITERFSEDCAGGRVWLVGAGPSDPGLFTLKGKQVLETADVVVYDALAGQEILSMIPENAKKFMWASVPPTIRCRRSRSAGCWCGRQRKAGGWSA